jgi:hypothetical protein
MVNHVQNDKGEHVIAVGAPGSVARVKVEFPALLEAIAGDDDEDALVEIKRRGITAPLEIESLLSAREPDQDSWGDTCRQPGVCLVCDGHRVQYDETCDRCGGSGRHC